MNKIRNFLIENKHLIALNKMNFRMMIIYKPSRLSKLCLSHQNLDELSNLCECIESTWTPSDTTNGNLAFVVSIEIGETL